MESAARRKQAAYNLALSKNDLKKIASIENWARNSSVNAEAGFLLRRHIAEKEDDQKTSGGSSFGKVAGLLGVAGVIAVGADAGVASDELARIGAAAVADIVGETGGTNTRKRCKGVFR